MANLINGLGGTAGFGENTLPPTDDSSSGLVDLTSIFPQGLSFFGRSYNSLYINPNGSLTFDLLPYQYGFNLGILDNRYIAPTISAFLADIDTTAVQTSVTPGGTSTGSNRVYWDIDTKAHALTVTWDDVAQHNGAEDARNAFQIRLTDRSAQTGQAGDFDIEFRYEAIDWAAVGTSNAARVGVNPGGHNPVFKLPQSGLLDQMLGLPTASNVGDPGVFVLPVHSADRVGFSYYPDHQTVYEGDSGSTPIMFKVIRTGDTSKALDVTYSLGGGTVDAQDIAGGALTGIVHFAAHSATAKVVVEVLGDTQFEDIEYMPFALIDLPLWATTREPYNTFVQNDDAGNLVGTSGDDFLRGGIKDDILNGGAGNDYLIGLEGNDLLIGGSGDDYLAGYAGVDTASYADAQSGVQVKLFSRNPQDTLGAGTDHLADNIENVIGSALNDRLYGNDLANDIAGGAGNDYLDARTGADHVAGGPGDDLYFVDNLGDTLVEEANAGLDTVISTIDWTLGANFERLTLRGTSAIAGTGNSSDNRLIGNAVDNLLSGLGGADRLYGNDGADRLIGGAGRDVLTGGAGADTFVFDTLEASTSRDVIADFVQGADHIALSASVFTALSGSGGALDAADFVAGLRAATAGQHLIYNANKGYLYYDADGAGGDPQVLIAILAGKPALAATDFLLV